MQVVHPCKANNIWIQGVDTGSLQDTAYRQMLYIKGENVNNRPEDMGLGGFVFFAIFRRRITDSI